VLVQAPNEPFALADAVVARACIIHIQRIPLGQKKALIHHHCPSLRAKICLGLVTAVRAAENPWPIIGLHPLVPSATYGTWLENTKSIVRVRFMAFYI
jgi:hypothetical protein